MKVSAEDFVSVVEGNDAPDVIFHEARFEVLELLDEGRKRHDEAKARAARLKQAKTIEDVLVPLRQRNSLSYAEVFDLITGALARESSRYGVQVCAKLDALVCMNLLYKSWLQHPPFLAMLHFFVKVGDRSIRDATI